MTEKIEENRRTAATEVFLTTAPGVGIVDSGCGKSVIGRRTLCRYLSALPEGQGSAKYRDDKHLFRFGNDTTEASKQSVQLPVGIGGRRGSLQVSVLDGKAKEAPLLISKPALRTLSAVLDFENSALQLKRIGTDVKLKEGPTGHYLLDLCLFPTALRRVKRRFFLMSQSTTVLPSMIRQIRWLLSTPKRPSHYQSNCDAGRESMIIAWEPCFLCLTSLRVYQEGSRFTSYFNSGSGAGSLRSTGEKQAFLQ